MNYCVACGEFMVDNNHHCNPVKEARIEAQRTLKEEFLERSTEFDLTESERLEFGMELLHREDEDDSAYQT